MNSVNIIGRVTKDLDLKYTPSGVPMLRFTVAVNRGRKTEGQPEADFINCVAFNKNAENMANYQKKGSQVAVTGSIQTGSYENQQGQRVYTTDILVDRVQFLDKREDNQQQANQQQGYQHNPQTYTQPQNQFNQQQGFGNMPNNQFGGQQNTFGNQQQNNNLNSVPNNQQFNNQNFRDIKEEDLPF